MFLPRESEATLLGGAIIAAMAFPLGHGRASAGLGAHMHRMSGIGKMFEPDASRREFHRRKYGVYIKMHDDFKKYQRMMEG